MTAREKSAKRGVAYLFFALGFAGANWLSRIPTIRATLALDDRGLGLLLLCSGVGAVIAFRTANVWSPRFSSRQLASGASVVLACLLVVPAATSYAPVAAVGLLISGYASGLVDIHINANAVTVEKRLGRPILSAMHGFCSLGSFCGAAVGTVAAYAGVPPFWHLLVVGAAMAVAGASVSSRLAEDEPAKPQQAATVRFSPPLVLLGAVAFCSSVGEGAMAQWTAVYLHDELLVSDGVASFGFAAYSAAMVTGRLLGDRLAGRWPTHVLLTRCGLLSAVSLALSLLAHTPGATIALGMGVGAGLSMVIPAVFRATVALPNVRAPSALAAVATLSYGGFLFGPPAIGLVAQASSLRVALWWVVALSLALAGFGHRVEALRLRQVATGAR